MEQLLISNIPDVGLNKAGPSTFGMIIGLRWSLQINTFWSFPSISTAWSSNNSYRSCKCFLYNEMEKIIAACAS
ncbi:hypothetical protein H5410_025963 [Solanum commersonii]|uniref:Uncharacterized protein n=1 Tax=Solanum commersonii TaxID=4109 RepID=A0A9J5YXJ6_SOLCO|nr:hypothetical protein H5410_025963 [Solanum commersonii]